MDQNASARIAARAPGWVPDTAVRYIAHTQGGQPIRAIARQLSCHPSTIMRQIRKWETRRDDPLIDEALKDLSVALPDVAPVPPDLSDEAVAPKIREALQNLLPKGAVLAVAAEMDMAVVVRPDGAGATRKTAAVPKTIAKVMAIRDLIEPLSEGGKIVRYFLTGKGRAEVGRLTALMENRATGFGEDVVLFDHGQRDNGVPSSGRDHSVTETPLMGLYRRRDKSGDRFLTRRLLRAGERLREDFRIAGLDGNDFHTAMSMIGLDGPSDENTPKSLGLARARLRDILDDLGGELCEVAVRCCCYLEGMERLEARMGWSARSAKIVVRIALQRLDRFYSTNSQSSMIG